MRERLSINPRFQQHLQGREELERLSQELCERSRAKLRPAKRRVSWNEVLGWVEIK
jgi:hypothetical protein